MEDARHGLVVEYFQAKAVAYESSATFFSISAASLTSKYVSSELIHTHLLCVIDVKKRSNKNKKTFKNVKNVTKVFKKRL